MAQDLDQNHKFENPGTHKSEFLFSENVPYLGQRPKYMQSIWQRPKPQKHLQSKQQQLQ